MKGPVDAGNQGLPGVSPRRDGGIERGGGDARLRLRLLDARHGDGDVEVLALRLRDQSDEFF